MTCSIVARDPATGDVGIAIASRALAVGAVAPFARAGVGAVSTQALPNVSYGPDALALLAAGVDPEGILAALTAADAQAAQRQAGVVDALGRSATWTRVVVHAVGGRARRAGRRGAGNHPGSAPLAAQLRAVGPAGASIEPPNGSSGAGTARLIRLAALGRARRRGPGFSARALGSGPGVPSPRPGRLVPRLGFNARGPSRARSVPDPWVPHGFRARTRPRPPGGPFRDRDPDSARAGGLHPGAEGVSALVDAPGGQESDRDPAMDRRAGTALRDRAALAPCCVTAPRWTFGRAPRCVTGGLEPPRNLDPLRNLDPPRDPIPSRRR
jgi:hypothetical protein